ncbi:uncharacterized acetyltransferase At3g50280 [Ziziphus jujuba]|uniref:Uncharacterized acetyltransferase At3g50280 n=1 Tax=Ziziphus jujuba TaxID=326968 RepID=A0ABM3ZUH6_ZIZJJ|nr:uncharacterized acetyltransferase At3g50280 [Ziziphus jujuba]
MVADGIAVADIRNAVNVPDDILHSFFPLNGVLNYEGIYKPLLAVQLTELRDGIFISCTMNHSVSNGTPFWHFFNTWSQISRGSRGDRDDHRQALQVSSQPPPLFAHRYLNGIIELPLRIPFEIPRTTFTPPPPIFQHRVFHFTKQTISQLKAKAKTNANAKMEIHNISSLQALLAHFWICVTRARNLKANQEVSLGVMIGMRSRLEQVFGRTVSHTSEEARKLLQDWAKDPIMFKSAGITDNTTLSLGSSHRYNIYGNDFGWGRPIAVRSSRENMSDGKMTVFSGAEEGSIDFEVWLFPEVIQAMVNDAEFMNTITV